jgi:hypothetical protein
MAGTFACNMAAVAATPQSSNMAAVAAALQSSNMAAVAATLQSRCQQCGLVAVTQQTTISNKL